MQVIVLDVLLIFPDLLERSFNPKDGLGLDVLMSLDSTGFSSFWCTWFMGLLLAFWVRFPDCPL